MVRMMSRLALAASAAAWAVTTPAEAVELRVDPAPLYLFDVSPERGIYDVVVHNILVVNDGKSNCLLTGLRLELLVNGEVVASSRVPAATVAKRASQIAQYDKAGVLKMLDFQFHLSRLLQQGETLSADRVLNPGEAYLNTGLYAASVIKPDTARIVAESSSGDLARIEVPVSRRTSVVRYRAPVQGRWLVVSSADAGHHHRWVASSEYALDIARFGPENRSHTGDGTRLTDYATFGAPVLAAANGVVVSARADRIDNEGLLRRPGMAYKDYEALVAEAQQATLMTDGFEGAAGNYVLLRHEGGEHTLYAHLRQSSVRVKPGDRVTAGQLIAEAGSSGNSTEPHLHFQVIDGPDLNTARGLPITFEGLVEDWFAIGSRHLRAGDIIEQGSAN